MDGELKNSLITFQTSHGVELRGTLHKLASNQVVFETYGPEPLLQMSEVLSNFTVLLDDRAVYSGRAVVSNIVHTGVCTICEVRLDQGWSDGNLFSPSLQAGDVAESFEKFLRHWGSTYRILPDFKVVIADIHSFLMDLRSWLEQIDHCSSPGSRMELERKSMEVLTPHTTNAIATLFDRFEAVARARSSRILCRPTRRSAGDSFTR